MDLIFLNHVSLTANTNQQIPEESLPNIRCDQSALGTPNAAWLLQCHALSGANGVVGGEVPGKVANPPTGRRKHIPPYKPGSWETSSTQVDAKSKTCRIFSPENGFVSAFPVQKTPKNPSLPSPVQLLVPFAAPLNRKCGGPTVLSQSEMSCSNWIPN